MEANHLQAKTLTKENFVLGKGSTLSSLVLFSSGFLLLILGYAIGLWREGESRHFLFAYLTSFCYFVSISLGAMFFVCIQHLSRASWSVAVRRLAEMLSLLFPLLFVLFAPILFNLPLIYEWLDTEMLLNDPVLASKAQYLNLPFFTGRVIVYFLIWIVSSLYLFGGSVKQDASGDVAITIGFQRLSAPIMILFGLSLTFFTFDLIMSLDPYWYSTILGVYFFSGSAVGIFAFLIVLSVILQSRGYLQAIKIDHYHNLGKFLFGFIIFWAYIGFSQYMLIWYANIPEETEFFLKRQSGEWAIFSLFLLLGHFVFPFLGLISRFAKRRKPILFFFAFWMLLMHYVDIYWLVMPEFSARPIIGLMEISTFLGIGAIYLAGFLFLAGRYSMIPLKDPRLADSLSFADLT